MKIYSGFRMGVMEGRLVWLAAAALYLAGMMAGAVAAVIVDLPSLEPLEDYSGLKWEQPTKLYDINGQLVAEFYRKRWEIIPLDRLPKHVIHAFISAEDRRFYMHRGLDFIGIARATVKNVMSGRVVEGGSTITQQLAKVLILERHERTFARKFQDMILSVLIERRFSKMEILERYLNRIYLGKGAYGIEAAANIYFNKTAADLTLGEAALLAGLPRCPACNNPFTHEDKARKAQWRVLLAMAEEGHVKMDEAETGFQEFWRTFEREYKPQESTRNTKVFRAPFFAEYVRRKLIHSYGSDTVYMGGLEVTGSIDLAMQSAAEQILERHLSRWNAQRRRESRRRAGSAESDSLPNLQGALVAIDPRTGEIRAMVGGDSWSSENQFNRATQSFRQPGSAFKVFVYISALESGLTPAEMVLDAPIIYQDKYKGLNWIPENYSKKYHGDVTVRYSLVHSLNVATVKLMEKVGARRVIQTAQRFGISSQMEPFWSLALGSFDANLLEITSAYSALANHGIRAEPFGIHQVLDKKGQLLDEHATVENEVATPEIAYLVTDALRAVVKEGTGSQIGQTLGRPAAGKTGTTNEFKDAWFIGYTPELACGIWVGYDDHALSLGSAMSGGRVVGPIWSEFVQTALKDIPPSDFDVPPGVEFAKSCNASGELATEFCPEPRPMAFISGTEPVARCHIHLEAQP